MNEYLEINKRLLQLKRYKGELFTLQLKVAYSLIIQILREDHKRVLSTSPQKLAKAVGVDKTTMHKYLSKLEEMQLIEVERPAGMPMQIHPLRFDWELQ